MFQCGVDSGNENEMFEIRSVRFIEDEKLVFEVMCMLWFFGLAGVLCNTNVAN